ncbi:uncharacterized protein LOC122044095 [Zingiber officinale]|uniref:uncharacterized protein LOC122044095 n=1 Tax=Zingiber officinale TaxID=94328 RepID=UPI001C4BCB81|nr:uncharacterized protein LOC122044095 [Zingiber officinale]
MASAYLNVELHGSDHVEATSTMNPSTAALPLLILLLLPRDSQAAASGDPLVRDTCKRAADSSDGHVDLGFCVQALESDAGSAVVADARRLALISANLTLANVTRTLYLAKTWVEYLTSCQEIYAEMSANVTDAMRTLEAGDLAGAARKMEAAAMLPNECDILLFQGDGSVDWGSNPLRKQDNYALFLASTSLAILRSLN